MRRLVIAIDYDDVLCDTIAQVVNDYNREYGASVGLEHIYTDSSETLRAFGVSNLQEAIQRLHKIYRRENYYQRLALIPGAQDAVKRLADRHELHLITGRQSFLEEATNQTLQRDFPGAFKSVEHTNYYSDENEKDAVSRSKGEVCASIGVDVLIDDHADHIHSAFNHGLKQGIIFGDYPWNEKVQLLEGMVRCIDWAAVEKEIERIANT